MFDDVQRVMNRMQSLTDDAFGSSPLAKPYALPNPNGSKARSAGASRCGSRSIKPSRTPSSRTVC